MPHVTTEALQRTLERCSEGHPVKAELTAWALYISPDMHGRDNDLSQLLQSALPHLSPGEQGALRAAAIANQRLTRFILDRLEPEASQSLVEGLLFAAPVGDAAGGHMLHPVAQSTIVEALQLPAYQVESGRRLLAYEIYPRIISGGYSPEATSGLELERLRYIAALPGRTDFARIERVFRDRLLRGEIWRADEVA